MAGLFVTVEGIDGSGKSTQARRLAARLRAAGRPVRETREPGGSEGAEEIRRLLVTGSPGRWSPETEILLFTAARRDHVERLIRPAVAAGEVVLCDRYVDSTRVYQGDGAERRALIDDLHARVVGLEADVTLWFDIAPDAAADRLADRLAGRAAGQGAAEDRFERKGAAFQTRLAARFAALAAAQPRRILRIDAGADADTVEARAWAALAPRLERARG